ncbi:hypothetical protein GE061_002668 [Apolygus lucorum]|uniref:Small ribosomal subunit protein eS21 n=1 Tax=Apolygus lucorum TaxID=248454 RepID=A0A8S9X5R5_APOLU|nr:hypothetical protein GE061_002668 [Apolygus lucorum]
MKEFPSTRPRGTYFSCIFQLITANMQNDAGEFVDLYCPRKCSASNRIIHAKDHASIQLAIADVDPSTGTILDSSKIYAICGNIRRMGESDDCITRLAKKDSVLPRNL